MKTIYTQLLQMQDLNYKKFQEKLVPDTIMLGIRTPQLQAYAKSFSIEDAYNYLNTYEKTCYEMDLLYGMLLTRIKMEETNRILYFKKFCTFVDNWAVCDMICTRLKQAKKFPDLYLTLMEELFSSSNPWYQRVVYVLLLNHYINETYIHIIFNYCEKEHCNHYYVNMSIAWLLSICYIKYPTQTTHYLKESTLDQWTINKTIQKN